MAQKEKTAASLDDPNCRSTGKEEDGGGGGPFTVPCRTKGGNGPDAELGEETVGFARVELGVRRLFS